MGNQSRKSGCVGAIVLLLLAACGGAAPTATVDVGPTQTREAELGQVATLSAQNAALQATITAPTATPVATPTPVPTNTPAATPTPTRVPPTPTTSGPVPAKLGGTIANDKIAITLHELEDNFPPGQYDRPAAGTRRIRFDVSIQNKGSAVLNYSAAFFKLKTADNREFNSTITSAQNQIAGGTISPGETVRGYLLFDVPAEAQVVQLTYSDFTNRGSFDLR